MMAYPFGGHPTIEEFVKYAVEQGCRKGEKPIYLEWSGTNISLDYLVGKNGLAVPLPILEEDEKYLTPRVVESLCKKLGIPLFHSNGFG